MTNEEVKVVLKSLADNPLLSAEHITKALYKAIELVEAQPCEDCVSREEVIEALRTWIQYGHLPNGDYVPLDYLSNPEEYVDFVRFEDAETCINEMPSVTPSRPKGKWIHWTDDYKDYVTCSCCEYGGEGEVLLSDKTPFCPICGADMRGD